MNLSLFQRPCLVILEIKCSKLRCLIVVVQMLVCSMAQQYSGYFRADGSIKDYIANYKYAIVGGGGCYFDFF